MPFKANADRRHHIPAQQHRVKNWAEYDAGLRARGSLTVWFTAEAIEGWRAAPRTTRGGRQAGRTTGHGCRSRITEGGSLSHFASQSEQYWGKATFSP